MEEQPVLDQAAVDQSEPRPRFRPYSSLLWLSRRLGRAATLHISTVREKIDRKVSLPTTQQLLGIDSLLGASKSRNVADSETNRPSAELRNLAERSHEVLAQAKTVFPFVLFPDQVILDRTKVTIIKKNFFWSEYLVSIRIEDVLNCTAGTDFVFGSLNIASRVMNSTDHYQIRFLWKKDALLLKHLIQGYVIAQHNNIRVSHLSKDDMIQTLKELGHDTNH